MLTKNLQKQLDEKWRECWPVSDLRPLALLDLISYLFFIKKLDDWELIHQKIKNTTSDNFIYTKEIEEFTWSSLQNPGPREIQKLFNKEYGVIDLMNTYAHLDGLYNDFFKAPLLIEPTPKLIINAIEIINLIETSDPITQGKIVEYLFSKSKVSAQNGQEFLPEYISRLMVSIADPSEKDIIFDPAAGTGSLLINCYKHVEKNSATAVKPVSSKPAEINVHGIESDLVQLRLAAMNMVLHGIKNPDVHFAPSANENVKKKPSLVISSLLFSNQLLVQGQHLTATNPIEKENLLFNEILENLEMDGRAVVLVPQVLLKSDIPSVIKTRKNLVEYFNLQAVITLPTKSDSLFSGAEILVFDKSKSSTEDIWFCKWSREKKKTRNEALSENGDENNDEELKQVDQFLHQWKTRNESEAITSRNSFFISANYLKTNKYNLSFNDYKLIRQQAPLNGQTENTNVEETETVLSAKKENLHEFFESSAPLPEKKRRKKMAPLLVVLVIIIAGAVAFYWFYVRNNYSNFFTTGKIDNSTNVSISHNLQPQAEAEKTSSSTKQKAIPAKQNPKEESNVSDPENTKYMVINKTWFHYKPDSSKIKPLYLTPRKDVLLTPKAEENGFVYVVYINSKGEATHGWLNKKDLEAVE